MAKLIPLLHEEIISQGGYTHMAIINADALTDAGTNTTQTIKLADIPANAIIQKSEVRLIVPFEATSDAAFNSTTASLGDAGSATRFASAVQLNKNGSYITSPAANNTAYQYTAAAVLNLAVTSMAAKALLSLNKGELHVFVHILDTKALSDAKGISSVTTKA